MKLDADLLRLGRERIDQRTVLDHMGERLARFDLAAEAEKHGAHRIAELGVGDGHIEDRLRIRGDRIPHADCLEQPPCRRRDSRSAQVSGMSIAQGGIHDRH